jgi:hypothetical protein
MSVNPSKASPSPWQVMNDAVLAYTDWREECAEVWSAYRSWISTPSEHAWFAYADYLAALDREEVAANAYAELMERVGRVVVIGQPR